jgi:superfamily II DNA or RNA helicase
MSNISSRQIQLFQSFFKGREDVFAIRWEKESKSGYMPAYDLDWNAFSQHKVNGGTLKDFPNKQFAKLTEERIANHLNGKEVIGLYPLLEDNTSWFIVSDFDESISSKKTWVEECRIFMDACKKKELPAYLERSRSGKGGHVWIFFDEAFPAFKSRKIILDILESVSIISPFDKNSNYDRLFPNQDYHSGKGLGNLIALPFQQKALANNNSCFIDEHTLLHFENQWEYLQNMQRVSVQYLDTLYNSISLEKEEVKTITQKEYPLSNGLQIVLNNQICITRNNLTHELITFLRDNLNFINSEYIIKKKLGKNTFGTTSYFKMLEEKDGFVLLPRGFIGKLLRFCNEQKIIYTLIGERKKLSEVSFNFKASLFDFQQVAVNATDKKEIGIIVAPPSSGKTIMGLSIVANKKQPTLIIVHRKQLFDQWIERIQSFLGIAEPFIGKIYQGKQKIGTHITVAMIQSLATIDSTNELFKSFGLIIIDECHHVPAKTFREVIQQFSSFYLYGLTATPIRKSNDEKLIFIHIGDVIHEVKFPIDKNNSSKKLAVIIRETDLFVPFDYKIDKIETLNQILVHDTERNKLIIDDIKTEASNGRKVLVLTERKMHIDVLYQYLKSKYEVITISGEDSEAARKIKLKQIEDGHFQILISTGQYFGEGVDLDNLECLVLAYPFAFEGKLIQYIGRVQRTEATSIIYDYRDTYIDYLDNQFKQRNKYYRKLLNAGQLKKLDELLLIFNEDKVWVNSDACVLPITCLDLFVEVERFREGIAWKVRVLEYDEENCILKTEIIDYNVNTETNASQQSSLQFLIIDKITFRAIDTAHLLRSVQLKQATAIDYVSEPIVEYQITNNIQSNIIPTTTKVLRKTMKVPFSKITFCNASVSFSLFVEEFKQDINFEIENADIRPEFEAIKEYFVKLFKKKIITVDIEISYTADEIISANATSENIDKINNSIIDSVRFEFVKREIISFKGKSADTTILNTIDNLMIDKNAAKLFKTEQNIIDDILSVKNSKHYYQLKYLSGQHLSSILKIRFILQPFSFLFLLVGEKKYHIVWETLYSEEATYIWHFEKTMDALRNGLKEIEIILNEIKATSKIDYLKKEHDNFSRVMHDYSDAKSGFVGWKGVMEEKLV